MPTIEIGTEHLLKAVSQMPEEELQRFITRLFTLKASQKARTLSERESELLIKIDQGLSPPDARRMKELIAKRQSYTVTEGELQESSRLTDESEHMNVERIKHLLESVHLQGATLDEALEQLGIKPAAA